MHKETQIYTKLLALFVFFLAPVFYFLISRRGVASKGVIKKILVVPQLTRIGDLICSTPAFRALKESFPQSKISVLVSKKASGIIANNKDIDELIEIEEYQGHFLGLVRKLREEHFDAGISLSGTALSSLLFFYGLIPTRVKLTRRPRPLMETCTDILNTCTKKYEHGTYIPSFYMTLLECVGASSKSLEKSVYTTKGGDIKVRTFLKENGIQQGSTVIGVSISAGYNKTKEWGIEKYEELFTKIHKNHSTVFIIIGTESDRVRIRELSSKTDAHVALALDFSLSELPSLFKVFNLFISGDTGPMHIADALNIPLIDIIGPVCDGELTPRGDNVIIVKSEPQVEPTIFAFKMNGNKEKEKEALENTSVESVLNAAEFLLLKSKETVV